MSICTLHLKSAIFPISTSDSMEFKHSLRILMPSLIHATKSLIYEHMHNPWNQNCMKSSTCKTINMKLNLQSNWIRALAGRSSNLALNFTKSLSNRHSWALYGCPKEGLISWVHFYEESSTCRGRIWWRKNKDRNFAAEDRKNGREEGVEWW